MVNNEFHLIGTAVTNFVNFSNLGGFAKYRLSVEIEVLGSKIGKVNRVDVEVYETNRAIQINQKLIGKQVAVNGYIDTFTNTKTNIVYTRLVAQNLLVLDNQPVVVEAVVNPNAEPPLPTADDPVSEEVVDDDLPF